MTGAQLAQWSTSHLADEQAVIVEEGALQPEVTTATPQPTTAQPEQEDHMHTEAERDDDGAQLIASSTNAHAVLDLAVDSAG